MGSLSQYHVALDGSNEYISIGNVAALDFDRLTAFSISAWVYLTGTTGVYTIFSKMQASTTYRGWGLFVDNKRLKVQHVNDWGAGDRLDVMTTSGVVRNGWHHVVVTMDGTGTAAGVKLYVDGTEITSKTTTYDALTATTIGTGVATIGRRGSAADQYWPGSIDEVSAYNIALSGAQVTTIYNDFDPPDLTVTGPTANLVGYWKIGDGDTYPTATDSSASANNGTYTNTEAADVEFGGGGEQIISGMGFSYAAMSSAAPWLSAEGGMDFTDMGITGGGGSPPVTTYYKMRAKDSLAGYVTWIATTPDFAGAGYAGGYPTPVGSMVVGSAVVATEWQG